MQIFKNMKIKLYKKKVRGNVTSMLIGLMYFMLLVLWSTFNYRMYILNATFEEIDDDLVSSILAGSLVNLEDYAEREQLVIHDDDVYEKDDTTNSTYYHGWTEAEAKILVSELNYESDILVDYTELPAKEYLNTNKRKSYTGDTYLNRSIQNTYSAIYANLCSKESMSSVGASIGNPNFIINHNDLYNGPLGTIVASNIEVTRLDIYNIYTANLATRHEYLSRFFKVTGTNSVTWSKVKLFGIEYTIDASTFPTLEKFITDVENKLAPMSDAQKLDYAKTQGYVVDTVEEITNGVLLEEIYNTTKHRYAIDADYVKSGLPLIIYTDNQVSFQDWYGLTDFYDANGAPYYLFLQGGNQITGKGAVTSVDTVNDIHTLAPCVGYSVYSYTNSNSKYGYAGGTYFDYKDITAVDRADKSNEIVKVVGGKYDGKNITKTSILMELTFNVQAFPTRMFSATGNTGTVAVNNGQIENDADTVESDGAMWGTKRVSVTRIIGINKLTEGY